MKRLQPGRALAGLTGRGKLLGALGVAMGLVMAPAPANAQRNSKAQRCVTAQPEEIERIIDIELEAAPDDVRARAALAKLECLGPRRMLVSVGSRNQELDLAVTDQRVDARVIALTIVELSEFPDLPAPSVALQPARTETHRVAAEPKRVDVWLLAANRAWLNTPYFTPGLALHVRYLDRMLALEAGLGAERGTVALDLGNVQSSSVSLHTTVAWRNQFDAFEVDAFAGFRIGYVALEAEPNETTTTRAETVSGIWGGPLVGGLGALRLSRSWSAGLRAEAGYAVLAPEATSDGRPETLWTGAWIQGGLLVGYTPGPPQR